MNLESKFKLLSECEDELICFVCDEWCKDAKRLNKCGHYFCAGCLINSGNICPKCKEYYSDDDIESTHWYDKIREDVQFLKNSLELLLSNVDRLKNEQETTGFPFRICFTDPKSFRRNGKGESKLHIACKRKNLIEVKKLILEKSDINSKDYASWTPLHEAIQAESIEIVEELLKNGAIIDSPGEFYVTPLHKAVLMENDSIIKLLIEYGADKELVDFNGRKPEDCTKRQDLLFSLQNTEVKYSSIKPVIYLTNNITVYCHSIDDIYKKKLHTLKKVKILQEFDIKSNNLTHVIVKKTHKLSLKILLSILKGLIIVPQEWIDSLGKGIMEIPLGNVLENNSKISVCMRESLVNNLMNKPKLFDGIKFFLEGPDDSFEIHKLPITKDFLKLLISVGGGENLSRAPAPRTVSEFKNFPYHASRDSSVFGCTNIIIFNDKHPPKLQYKMPELQHKSCQWLIDCVLSFKLI